MAWAPWLAVLTLLVLPGAQAQSGSYSAAPFLLEPLGPTPTALYFHLHAGSDLFPINTQPPEDLLAPSVSPGLAAGSLACGDASNRLPGGPPATYRGASSASRVEYDFIENGRPRIHLEPGLAGDVHLTPGAPAVLHWYTTTFAGTPDAPAGADPVLPGVVARATLRQGPAPAWQGGDPDAGALLGGGETEPATLVAGQAALGPTGAPSRQVTVARPGAPGSPAVYDFAIPLAVPQGLLPAAGGYTLRVDLFLRGPGCDAMVDAVRPFTDPTLRPRIELSVDNALRMEPLHVDEMDGAAIVHAEPTSPWGAYDVDASPGALLLEVDGPHGPMAFLDPIDLSARIHGSDHYGPVRLAYVWPHAALHVPDGTYTFTLRPGNLQHTAAVYAKAAFLVEAPRQPSICIDTCGNAPLQPAPAPHPGRTLQAPLSGVVPLALALLASAARKRPPTGGKLTSVPSSSLK